MDATMSHMDDHYTEEIGALRNSIDILESDWKHEDFDTDEMVRIQDELEEYKKALEVALEGRRRLREQARR